MTQINLLLQEFFSKNPDVKEARNKGLVNRRALAGYIARQENLHSSKIEALVTALRRFETGKKDETEINKIIKDITITTKDNIAVVSLEKSDSTLQKLQKVISKVSYAKNETLKIVEGSSVLKLFIDEFNLNKIKDIFTSKEIHKIQKNVAELNMVFPESANKIKGIVSFVTSELTVDKINIIELLTATPELIIYVNEKDLLRAYHTVQRMKRN